MKRDSHDVVVDQTSRLLDYLSAVAREVGPEPTRDVTKHDHLIWPSDVPVHREVALGTSSERATWLRVRRVPAPAPVQVGGVLESLLDAATLQDPEGTPRFDEATLRPWIHEMALAEVGIVEDGTPELAALYDDAASDLRAEVDEVLTEWLSTVWEPWARRARLDNAARKLYATLYELHLRADAEQDQFEVVWGHLVMSLNSSVGRVVAPLLTVAVVVDVDADDGTISITPERELELELDALEGVGLPGFNDLVHLRTTLRDAPPDPWSSDERAAVRRQLVAPLGLDAELVDSGDVVTPGRSPRLNNGWVVMLRRRPMRQERFYDELATKLRADDRVPDALASVVADNDQVDAALHAIGRDATANDGTADRLLMPLPSNQEQERIARQLSTSRGVTVQGPPGTGKSHTIVNLVSHLVAQGKRVLVTAQNDQALTVLRDKIPEEIRDLSIAVLGSTPAAMEELRSSAQRMQDGLSALDLPTEHRRIAELGTQVDTLRESLRRTDRKLVEALRSEQREYEIPRGPARAPDVAAWLAEHRSFDVIPDAVPAGSQLPLTVPELDELRRLAATLEEVDIAAAGQELPVHPWLPPSPRLRAMFDELYHLREKVSDLEDSGLDLARVDRATAQEIAAVRDLAGSAAEELAALGGGWEERLGIAVRQGLATGTFVIEQNGEIQSRMSEVRALRGVVAGYEIDVPEGDPQRQLPLVAAWRERLSSGKKLPMFGAKELKEFADAVRVSGYPVSSADQLDLVQAAISLRALQARLRLVMQGGYEPLAIPVPPSSSNFAFETQALADRVDAVAAWWIDKYPRLRAELKTWVKDPNPAISADALTGVHRLLADAGVRRAERDAAERLGQLKQEVERHSLAPGASPLWVSLSRALAGQDVGAWERALSEASRLYDLRPSIQERARLADALVRAGAPIWAQRVLASRGDLAVTGDTSSAPTAWIVAAARTWITALHGESDLDALMRRAHDEGNELRARIVELASRSARANLRANTKDRQRKALETWLTAIRKVGKGTGKNAPRFQAQARSALPEAMGSVPVWIMPIYRVMENFDPTVSEPFDVVIVDESSQCDLLTLGVLALASKAVIVGDDKQTSPQAVGIRTDRIFDLQSQFIGDLPDRALLTMDESLYSISGRAFPSTILLREHFRCVPEIIGFSNRFYSGNVLPLREVTVPAIGKPMRAVRVDGQRVGTSNVNEVEADALVDQVVECASDPRYEGLSFGVVTLMSGPQAQVIEAKLLERLGVQEYEQRRLRVGNPPVFQGDERNVVFVSMVADSGSYAWTRLQHEQWANVAVSRAQDQLWVFYSVDPTTLNANDLRRALIDYIGSSGADGDDHGDLFDLTESQFERDVLAQMLARGHAVKPQYRVGSYRIDFVVVLEGGERLAVECDGDSFHGADKWDDDVRRQRVLERLGWNFWRVRASSYYLDPEAALQPLWDRLEAMRARGAEREARRQAHEMRLAQQRQERIARAAAEAEAEAEAQRASSAVEIQVLDFAAEPAEDVTVREVPPSPQAADWAGEARRLVAADVPQPAPAEVRAWARANGIPVGERGRIRPEVIAAFIAASTGPAWASGLMSTQERHDDLAGGQPSPLGHGTRFAEEVDGGLPDPEDAWRTARRYQLNTSGRVVSRDSGRDLADAVGEERARAISDELRRARPGGGIFKVDDEGTVMTMLDGDVLPVMRVTRTSWFPEHWESPGSHAPEDWFV